MRFTTETDDNTVQSVIDQDNVRCSMQNDVRNTAYWEVTVTDGYYAYGSDQTSSVTTTVNSTAQLIASAANALASSSQIQQQISGNSTITTISGAKISLPTQPARFVALPTQPATMVRSILYFTIIISEEKIKL